LPFIVAATKIGVVIGAVTTATAAAFVAAGLVSALVFPAVGLALMTGEPAVAKPALPGSHPNV